MCPFACLAEGSGPTVYKSLAIALLAGAIGVMHSMASPLKLTVDAPVPLETLLGDTNAGSTKETPTPTRNARVAPTAAEPKPTEPKPTEPAPAEPKPAAPVHPAPPVPAPAPVPAPTSTAQPTKAGDASMISLEQAKTLFDRVNSAGDVSFVDARNPDEFATGRIPSALNMPPSAFIGGQIPPDLQFIPTSNIVVVYCNGGECDASKLTAIRMREQGYQKVFVFEQGMTGWNAAKLPVEK